MSQKTIKSVNRVVLILVLTISLITILSTTVYASINDVNTAAQGGTANGTATQAQKDINEGIDSLINTVRGIAIGVAVVMIILIGASVASGGARSIAEHKVRAGIFLLALILVFKTESILGTLFKVLHIDISKYL